MLKAFIKVKTPNGVGTLIGVTKPDDDSQPQYMVAHHRSRFTPEFWASLGKQGPVVHLFYPLDQVEPFSCG